MIRTLIVDDEIKSQTTLNKLISKYCPEVEVIEFANNVKTAIEAINKLTPDLVFLDISMPDGDGFDVLKGVKNRNFELIFTTAFNDYAIKAFQYSALHYLLKPINYLELQDAVNRYQENSKDIDLNEKIRVLYDSLNNQYQKIILPTLNGLRVIELNQIIRCEADGSYTNFHLEDDSVIMVSRVLSSFEELLPPNLFSRVHSKHLVNLNYISQYIKGRGGRIVLLNDKEVEVSESRKKDFLKKLKELAHSLANGKR